MDGNGPQSRLHIPLRIKLRKAALRSAFVILYAIVGVVLGPGEAALSVVPAGAASPPELTSGPKTLTALNQIAEIHPGQVDIAILDTAEGLLYSQSDNRKRALASVGKVYIMIAYLDRIEREGREPTYWEYRMMEAMIEESDNRSATDLWELLGRTQGLAWFLWQDDLPAVEPADDDSWGSMRASALDVGLILRRLYNGWLLNRENTAYALQLLANVTESQDWGLGLMREFTVTYFKNGWYPEEGGWIVNSAGIIEGGAHDYVVVLLTDSHPTLEDGVGTIESIVRIVRAVLLD